MKAVILAAGEGKRMFPLTETRPKVMVPIANKPIVEHLLIELLAAGVDQVLFVVGYHSEKIREYFGDGSAWGIRIQYATQKRQLGTADAVRQVARWAGPRFILANGDIIVGRDDIRNISSAGTCAMGLFRQQDVAGLGVVEVQSEQVVRIHEKVANPPSNLVNAGIYLLTDDIFSAIDKTNLSSRGEYELTDSLQLVVETGPGVKGKLINSWLNLTYPWDLLQPNGALLQSMDACVEGLVEDGARVTGKLALGKGSIVRAGSYIVGPVSIGSHCDIGPNCYMRPATAIGNRCHIGAFVEVKNSVIMSGTKIPHHNYIGDSVIGEDCNLGAGTKTANLRLDRQPIVAMGVNTGLKKLGALIGDGVQTGINVSINVGCCIGGFSTIGPGAIISGTLMPRSSIT